MTHQPKFAVGDRVRILTGFLGGGRDQVVAGIRHTVSGVVVDVDVTGPKLILDPHSEQETTRLPYAPHELEHASVGSGGSAR